MLFILRGLSDILTARGGPNRLIIYAMGTANKKEKNQSLEDLSAKAYKKAIKSLDAELVALQEWVKTSKAKVCIIFEGRDTAGKGGVIKAITARVSPRIFRVVALPAPTDYEKTQLYIQRYVSQLPAGGEIVIFDRSWYNRAGVERVMGFCTPQEAKDFLTMVPTFEKTLVDAGIILLKYWLEVSPEEQTKRLQSRIDDARKIWKLSDLDLASYTKWDEYSVARDEMFTASDTGWAPWYVVESDFKRRARVNVITHLLQQIPYEPLAVPHVELPARPEIHSVPAGALQVRKVLDAETSQTAK